MESIFDLENTQFLVLVNADNQHSLWPEAIPIPTGWKAMTGPASRAECIAYVDENWTDLRPTGSGVPAA